MPKNYIQAICLLFLSAFFLASCGQSQKIANFEECVAAGNQVLESYPRQCSANGQNFTEQIQETPIVQGISSDEMTITQSMELAKKWLEQNSKTYKFDGSDLAIKSVKKLDCQNCFEAIFTFNSKYLGYGDRSQRDDLEKLNNLKLLTPHEIVVSVEKNQIKSALTDGQYDEIDGALK